MSGRKTRDELTRADILAMLYRFVNQRPGLEFGNYGDIVSYRSESRRIAQQKSDALTLLRTLELSEQSIPRDAIVAALDQGRRLHLDVSGGLDYDVGQYWPTEYRAAVARLAADLIWRAKSAAHPELDGHGLRARFRSQYGRGLASRWFS